MFYTLYVCSASIKFFKMLCLVITSILDLMKCGNVCVVFYFLSFLVCMLP